MLVLSRKRDERIVIGDEIVITIVEVRDGKVRLGIDAPDNVLVYRQELYDRLVEDGSISPVIPAEAATDAPT